MGATLFLIKNCWTLSAVWAGVLINHPSWEEQMPWVFKKKVTGAEHSLSQQRQLDHWSRWVPRTLTYLGKPVLQGACPPEDNSGVFWSLVYNEYIHIYVYICIYTYIFILCPWSWHSFKPPWNFLSDKSVFCLPLFIGNEPFSTIPKFLLEKVLDSLRIEAGHQKKQPCD